MQSYLCTVKLTPIHVLYTCVHSLHWCSLITQVCVSRSQRDEIIAFVENIPSRRSQVPQNQLPLFAMPTQADSHGSDNDTDANCDEPEPEIQRFSDKALGMPAAVVPFGLSAKEVCI